jgi:hypothetical protein
MPKAITKRISHSGTIFLKPFAATLYSAFGVIGIIPIVRDELIRHRPGETIWHIADFLPKWTIWEWVTAGLFSSLLVLLEGSYRHSRDSGVHYTKTIFKRDTEIRQLQAKLLDGPKVTLSHVGNGVDLRVECFNEQATNVRLVELHSPDYSLRSEVIRYLRAGSVETLVVRGNHKDGQSAVLSAFSSPILFFTDLMPRYEGKTAAEAFDYMKTVVTERNLVVPFEIAYTNTSGKVHYRSSFRVRWDPLRQSIVDVEPNGILLDNDPPPTEPLHVVRSHLPKLEYHGWHSGDARSFPSEHHGGHPSWVAIKNTQKTPAMQAVNVTARLEFIDSNNVTRFVVPQVPWYRIQHRGTAKTEQWCDDVTIEGGEEQSFVLFVESHDRRILAYKGPLPIGHVDYDHWRIKIIVRSDNAQGFEGEIGFTLSSNQLTPDQPAFKLLRTVDPLVKS